ncbi:MAG TPA: acyl-CoA dehydrogenase family protein [Amycolatopsis sp.]|nr:acyl-CoA dehydrogenase family protein [Amycolatopsis sp.]
MHLSLTDQQRDVVSSVRAILAKSATTSPVAELDRDAFSALEEGGFLDLGELGGGRLEAVLVVDEAGAAGVCAPVAAKALVAPAVTKQDLPAVVGLAAPEYGRFVRFGAEAEAFLVLDGDEAVLAALEDVAVERREMRWGYPSATVTVHGGQRLGPGTGPVLLRAWRTALAAEAGGLMRAAVLKASKYVTERKQFGRPIGGYQSVQHRLARGWMLAEGTTWLARRAGWFTDDDLAAAAAACYACKGMREVFRSVHQVVGGMGITDEFGLTRLTGKLAYLHTELGGATANARALAAGRWLAARSPAAG